MNATFRERREAARRLGLDTAWRHAWPLCSDRKQRLFACAWCRRIWHRLDELSKRTVEVVEQFVDGLATVEQMNEARSAMGYHSPGDWEHSMAWCAASKIVRVQMGRGSADWESEAPPPDVELRLLLDISGASCDRDVSANVLKWNGGCVVKVAAAIYDERAFDRMPILADALEDAGCDNADILNHCREPGEHVRGCWVLDLLLGKK